jgi:hypothetical protein
MPRITETEVVEPKELAKKISLTVSAHDQCSIAKQHEHWIGEFNGG